MNPRREQPAIVAKVPHEIWAEIFCHAQKTLLVEATYDETEFKQCDVPISVSQVCDRFRKIALNTPRLWTFIVADFSSPSSLRATKLWLERSKNCPLSLFIQNVKGSRLENSPDQRECFRLLLSHLGRWREAAIEWSETDFNFWGDMGIVARAPFLESLVLEATVEEDKLKQGLFPSMLWACSPRFRKLAVFLWVVRDEEDEFSITNNGYSPWTASNGISYEELTHLRLDPTPNEIVSFNEILGIFKGSPNLVCCFFEGVSAVRSLDNEHPCVPVLVPRLRHLYLAHNESVVARTLQPISEILYYITAPSLLSLTIVDDDNWGSTVYERFLVRSSCPLEELNLINTILDLDQIQNCMESTSSSLRRLHINKLEASCKEDHNAFVARMAEWDSVTNGFMFCPHLEQVSLAPRRCDIAPWGWSNSRFRHSVSLIAEVLEARLRPPVGGEKVLKTFLHPSTLTSHVSKSRLEEMRKEPWGLKIGLNDDIVDEDTRNARLWERLAYQ